jgi:DNA-directed RNA polymerase specialized sigma24 family protein
MSPAPLGSPPSWSGRSSTSTLWSVIEFAQGSDDGALDALAQLVERYRPTIRKYLGERLRDFDPENAEATLAHVVLPKLIQRATRRSRKGSFRRLLRLAVNAYVVDRLRESTVVTGTWPRVESADLIDERDVAKRLKSRQGKVAQYLCDHLPVAALRRLDAWDTRDAVQPELRQALITSLDDAVIGQPLWQESRFAKISLRTETRTLAQAPLPASGTSRLNRLLLEDAFPLALARSKAGTEHTSREVFDSEILDNLLDAEDDDPAQPGDGMDAEFALRTFVEACTRFRELFLARKGATQAELEFLLTPPERDGEEVGVRELASALGITPEALKVRRHRAREALRMVFGQCVADIVTRQRLDEEVRILEDLLCRALGANPFEGLKPPRPQSE